MFSTETAITRDQYNIEKHNILKPDFCISFSMFWFAVDILYMYYITYKQVSSPREDATVYTVGF